MLSMILDALSTSLISILSKIAIDKSHALSCFASGILTGTMKHRWNSYASIPFISNWQTEKSMFASRIFFPNKKNSIICNDQ